jgi:hypothetical protein
LSLNMGFAQISDVAIVVSKLHVRSLSLLELYDGTFFIGRKSLPISYCFPLSFEISCLSGCVVSPFYMSRTTLLILLAGPKRHPLLQVPKLVVTRKVSILLCHWCFSRSVFFFHLLSLALSSFFLVVALGSWLLTMVRTRLLCCRWSFWSTALESYSASDISLTLEKY